MRQKNILTTILVISLTLLASCSDADDYDYNFTQEDAWFLNSTTANYRGTWQVEGGTWQVEDHSNVPKNDLTSGGITLLLAPDVPTLTIIQMPVQLFLQLAGKDDATVETAQPYNIQLKEKGYSSATIVYEATTTPYTCTFRHDGQLHQLNLSFLDRSEVAVNAYLNTLTANFTLTSFSIDDAPAEAVSLTLSINAEKQ